MKFIFKIFMYVVIALVVLFLFRNYIAKGVLKFGVKKATGLTLDVEKVNVNPLKSFVNQA